MSPSFLLSFQRVLVILRFLCFHMKLIFLVSNSVNYYDEILIRFRMIILTILITQNLRAIFLTYGSLISFHKVVKF